MAAGALTIFESWFHQSSALLLLLLVPALIVIWLALQRRRRVALDEFLGLQPLASAPSRRRVGFSVWVIALISVIIGSAGPLGGRDPEMPTALRRDLLIVLDVSQSMLAEDRPPLNRLNRAKEYLREFVDVLQRRGGYRLGLVTFAGQARVVCPLSEDYDYFRFALDEAHPHRLGPQGRLTTGTEGEAFGTSLRPALERAVAAQDVAAKGFRDILLITDGDDLAGDYAQGTALARADHIPVHVLGIGDASKDWFIPTNRPGEPYLIYEAADGTRQRAVTRRRDAVLREIANGTGATVRMEEAAAHPLVAWFQEKIAPLPGRDWGAEGRPLPKHIFSWFFAAALVLLMGEALLSEWRRRQGGA